MATPRAIPAGVRAVAVCLTPLLLLLLPAAPAAAAPTTPRARSAAVSATDPVDTTSRAAVAAAYADVYLPAVAVTAPAPAADAASRCAAGTTPSNLQNATLDLVNYVRRMSGVAPVTLNTTYSSSAQRAALMMYASGAVKKPDAGWTCASDAGLDGLRSSDVTGTATGADAVRQYMDAGGDDHANVLSRSRLQRPNVVNVGTGSVGSYSALWVTTTRGNVSDPTYTTWPSSGYFPDPLEPAGRWSVTNWNPDNSLSRATVRVTGPDGRDLPVVMHGVDSGAPRAGASLVFEVGALPAPSGARVDTYTVTVTNITNTWGDTLDDLSYPVQLFDPAADAPPAPVQITATGDVAVIGIARVGEVLTATAPTWSQTDATTTYAWLRNGTPVAGATGSSYALTAADVGARISVRATGTKDGSLTGTSLSDQSLAVTKAPSSLTVTATSTQPGQAHLAVAVSAAVSGIGGTVDVREGSSVLASAQPVTDGSATVDLTGLSAGPHTVTVTYGGDTSVAAATGSTTLTVPDAVDPGLTVSATSAAVGQLALDVAVQAGGQPAAGGTVSVQEGPTTLQSGIAVSAGTARYQGSKLTPGAHTFTVTYSGTARVKASSTTITTTIKAKAKPTVAVRGRSASKGKLTLTVTVTAAGHPGLGGTVTVKEGSKTRATLTVTKGRASWSTTKVTKGRHTYTVSYRGTSQVTARSVKKAVAVR